MIAYNDFKYYKKWDFKSIFKNYTGDKGYIFLQPWPGGFNNIRMSFEISMCLSYLSNRVLILPPKYKMYLLEGENHISDFFNLDHLGIHYLLFEEFCELKGIEKNIESIKQISRIEKFDSVANVIIDSLDEIPSQFLRGRSTLKLHQVVDNSEIIYLDKNLLGNFYTSIYTDKQIELNKLIAKYSILKEDLFNLATRIISRIGDGNYYSIHIRRNDFQYKEVRIDSNELVSNIKDIIPFGSKLYISTDHNTSDSFFNILKEKYNVVFYEDVSKDIVLENINWIPILEMLICTRGIRFIGTKLSTFSSYIYRMRGYMDDIQDKSYYINTEPFDPTKQGKFLNNPQFNGNWSREYPDVWNFI
jgi:hypothetical protein